MLKPLRLFLKSKKPDYEEAVSSLRLLFVGAFGMQLLFSLLVGTIAALAVGIQPGGSSLVASVMLIFALLSSPLALLVASFASRGGGKAGAIAAAIALGVLLSTPAWFMLLTLLTGGAPRYLLLFLGMLAVYCGFGFLLAGRYARLAVVTPSAEVRSPKAGMLEDRPREPQLHEET